MYYVGLMSGTSLDGLDVVISSFEPRFAVTAAHTHPFPSSLRTSLEALTYSGVNEIERLASADLAFASFCASAIEKTLRELKLSAPDVVAIGSHGQTIRHLPELGFSLQIGDPNLIAELTGIDVIADFRRRDLAAGGQGAPLVPAFHDWLFRTSGVDRAVVNIGGIANITLLRGDGDQLLGFDTGPGNLLMDAWCLQHTGAPFDDQGTWAQAGTLNEELLSHLLDEPYFHKPFPKSTGRELFNTNWLRSKLLQFEEVTAVDVQRTLAELTARTIADHLRKLNHQQLNDQNLESIYLCGGGAHNRLLLSRLEALLPDTQVLTTTALGLDPDWVEAAAFAWLAYRTLNAQHGNAPSVTGAKGERILGAIYQA